MYGIMMFISYIFKYVKKSELISKSGYILANTKAAISFLRNLDGASLMKGEIKIKKHWEN